MKKKCTHNISRNGMDDKFDKYLCPYFKSVILLQEFNFCQTPSLMYLKGSFLLLSIINGKHKYFIITEIIRTPSIERICSHCS